MFQPSDPTWLGFSRILADPRKAERGGFCFSTILLTLFLYLFKWSLTPCNRKKSMANLLSPGLLFYSSWFIELYFNSTSPLLLFASYCVGLLWDYFPCGFNSAPGFSSLGYFCGSALRGKFPAQTRIDLFNNIYQICWRFSRSWSCPMLLMRENPGISAWISISQLCFTELSPS